MEHPSEPVVYVCGSSGMIVPVTRELYDDYASLREMFAETVDAGTGYAIPAHLQSTYEEWRDNPAEPLRIDSPADS